MQLTENYAATPEGLLLIADGMGPMQRWNGVSTTLVPAGTVAPATAPTLAASGNGQLIGAYTAYCRFVDDLGNFSDLSPVSNAILAQGPLLVVLGATNATPIQVTTATNHNLTSGWTVNVFNVAGNTNANGEWTVTVIDNLNFTLDNSNGNGAFANPPALNVQSATNTAPIKVGTTTAHGLLTGAFVSISGVGGNTAANGGWVVAVVDAFNFTLFGSAGNGAYTSGGAATPVTSATAGAAQFNYTNVPVPTGQAKVKRRQLLRNTTGEALTFYVALDTTDLTSTSFSESLTDQQLLTQVPAPLFDTNGIPLANSNGVPPSHKYAIQAHLGRMFATAERDYTRGCVQVTNGSTQVQGVNTDWQATFVSRWLYVTGAQQAYQIDAVDVANQVLTLHTAYADASDIQALYAVRPAPAERRLVYYTMAGQPESWPAFNALSVQEDGDELTGLMAKGSFLYILEHRHIYRFTFQSDPALDGFVFLASDRGCVNQRCWVKVEDNAYMLDQYGVHAFGPDGASHPMSEPIQRFFQPYETDQRINWAASDYFHAVHSPGEEVIRFFVAFSGEYLPRHALCYHYRKERWWVEEYYRPVGCSALGVYLSQQRIFVGCNANQTMMYGASTLDGVDPTAGKSYGQVSSADLWSITDNAASPPAGVVGNPVVITSGRGRGQTNVVTAYSGGRFSVRRPWLVLPDSTSTYQLGGILWEYETGWFRYHGDEEQHERRLELLFEPTANPAQANLQVYSDFANTPIVWGATHKAAEADGMSSTAGDTVLAADLTNKSGFAQQRMDGSKELHARGPRFISISVEGVSSADFQAIYQLAIDGVKEA